MEDVSAPEGHAVGGATNEALVEAEGAARIYASRRTALDLKQASEGLDDTSGRGNRGGRQVSVAIPYLRVNNSRIQRGGILPRRVFSNQPFEPAPVFGRTLVVAVEDRLAEGAESRQHVNDNAVSVRPLGGVGSFGNSEHELDDLFLARRIADAGAELLQAVVHRRYKLRRSIVVTSNRVVQDWGKYLGDNTMSGTILDRLMHRSVLLEFEGKSYRLKEAAARLARDSTDD